MVKIGSLSAMTRHMRGWLWFLLSLALVVLIGGLEYVSGKEFSVTVFYLIPIALAAWYAHRDASVLVAFVSIGAFFVTDALLGNTYANRLAPYWNATTRLSIYLGVILILSGLKESLAREKDMARFDDLTGAANRRYFIEKADAEIKRALRYHRPISIAYIDIDDFKPVNDQLGHSAGDRLLRVVAETMQANIRGTDMVARLGGDEFVLLLPETGSASARTTTQRVLASLVQAMSEHNRTVTFSIGALTFAVPPDTVDELLRKADAMMYGVKSTGKNRIDYRVVGKEAVES